MLELAIAVDNPSDAAPGREKSSAFPAARDDEVRNPVLQKADISSLLSCAADTVAEVGCERSSETYLSAHAMSR